MARIFLTVDDAPSERFGSLVDYLHSRNHHAVFFCRGDALERSMDAAADALKKGFILGNHSYSHPRFSKIRFEEGETQIMRTEALLDEAHRLAGVVRRAKYFRFPYCDTGGWNALGYSSLLGRLGFTVPDGLNLKRSPFPIGRRFDWSYAIDTDDWKLCSKTHPGFTLEGVERRLDDLKDGDVVLMHDHVDTADLFPSICDMIEARGFAFASPV